MVDLELLNERSTPRRQEQGQDWRSLFQNIQLSTAAHMPEIAERVGIPVVPELALSETEREQIQLLQERGVFPSGLVTGRPPYRTTSVSRSDIQRMIGGFYDEDQIFMPEITLPEYEDPRGFHPTTIHKDIIEGLTYATRAITVGINSLYEMARPERFTAPTEGFEESTWQTQHGYWQRVYNYEEMHPDISLLASSFLASIIRAAEPYSEISEMMGTEPGLLTSEAAQREAQGIGARVGEFAEPEWTEASQAALEESPILNVLGTAVTETVLDPLMWIPGAGGFVGALKGGQVLSLMDDAARVSRYNESISNIGKFLEFQRMAPTEMQLMRQAGLNLDASTERWLTRLHDSGIRTPSVGEWIGYGTNRANARVRTFLDPYGDLRRVAIAASRIMEANAVDDLQRYEGWQAIVKQTAKALGKTEEEVASYGAQLVEEVFAANQSALRPRGQANWILDDTGELITGPRGQNFVDEITPAQHELMQRNQTRRLHTSQATKQTLKPPEFGYTPEVGAQQRFFDLPEEVARIEPDIPALGVGREGAEYTGRPGFYEPREAGRDFIPGVTEPPVYIETPGQGFLFDRPSPQPNASREELAAYRRFTKNWPTIKEKTDELTRLWDELDLRGVPDRPVIRIPADATLLEVEYQLSRAQRLMTDIQTNRLAGVRYVIRSVEQGLPAGSPLYQDYAGSVIREAIPAFRDADAATVKSFSKLLYEIVQDSLNVGSAAPLRREALAGMVTEPLDDWINYLKHLYTDEVLQAWDNIGPSGIRAGTPRALESQIFHGATKQRAFRGSIAGANRSAAEGRAYLTDEGLRILKKGEFSRPGWVKVSKVFEDDFAYLALVRRMGANRAVSGLGYVDEAMTRFGVSSTDVPTGAEAKNYYRIFDLADMSVDGKATQRWTNTFGKLKPELQERLLNTYFKDEGYMRRGDMARAVLRYYEMAQGKSAASSLGPVERIAWSVLKPMTTYFKAKTLFPFMSYHMRNIYDDLSRGWVFFDHWTPALMAEAEAMIYRGALPMYIRKWTAKVTGKSFTDTTVDDFLGLMRKEGVFDNGFISDEINRAFSDWAGLPDKLTDIEIANLTGRNMQERLRAGMVSEGVWHSKLNPFSTNFIVDQKLRQAGIDLQNMGRLTGAFAAIKEEGMTLERLGRKVRDVFIDYRDVDPITDILRQTAIPFATFTRKVIPLQLSGIFQRSARLSMKLRAYDTIDRMANAISEEESVAPSWMKGRVYRFGENIWFRPQNYDSAFELGDIVTNLEEITEGDMDAYWHLMDKFLNPIYTEGAQQTMNRDWFTGRTIYDSYSAKGVPQWWIDLGFSDEMAVRLDHSVGSVFRVLNEQRRVRRAFEDGLQPLEVARFTLGAPLYESGDASSGVHYQLIENRRLLENNGVEWIYGSPSVYGVPPSRVKVVGDLLWERLSWDFSNEEYLQMGPRTELPRPFVDEEGESRSQLSIIEKMESDISALFRLQDMYEELQAGTRRGMGTNRFIPTVEPVMTPEEAKMLDNMAQALILTKIAILFAGAQAGEINSESAAQRVQSAWRGQLESEIAPAPVNK